MNKPRFWYSRGYLPHFDGGEIYQFITFRLADSLPQTVLKKWKIEIERNLVTEIEVQRRIERYLDSNYGECHLKNPSIALSIVETLEKFDGVKFKLASWVIMPNHVHLLLKPKESFSLADILHSIKSFTAHQANKILNCKGRFWSKEYFDRYIRDAEHFEKTVRYIHNNPVKAGLCEKPEDWQFSSASERPRPRGQE